jgi:hypothetical protein
VGVVSEDTTTEKASTLPKGCMVRYREWYGKRSDNVGLKLRTPRSRSRSSCARTPRRSSPTRWPIPAIFKEDGGPSIAEEMHNAGVTFRRADNTRLAGWAQVRPAGGDDDGNPMVACFDTCMDSKRTIPALMHDDAKPEDVDTDLEDHAADDWRYACMSPPLGQAQAHSRDPKFIDTSVPTMARLPAPRRAPSRGAAALAETRNRTMSLSAGT